MAQKENNAQKPLDFLFFCCFYAQQKLTISSSFQSLKQRTQYSMFAHNNSQFSHLKNSSNNLHALLDASKSPFAFKFSNNFVKIGPYTLIMPKMMLLQRNAATITHHARAPPSGGSIEPIDLLSPPISPLPSHLNDCFCWLPIVCTSNPLPGFTSPLRRLLWCWC